MRKSGRGFTLIEVLVVVLIIAVLTAVAMPMYKRAVLKSRFSTVMPMAKSVADAQEIYYLNNGEYALGTDELDVTPLAANNTTVSLSQTDGYDYVLAQRSDVPELHYVMYQRNSANYPGEIHCEAQDNNTYAEYVCKSFGGTQDIGKTITDGYTTYVISGTGATALPSFDEAEEVDPMSCDKAREMGFTCTPNAENHTKQMCIMVGTQNMCRTKTYGEDGKSYTSVTCKANSEGVCTSDWKSATYDANGNMTSTRQCATLTADGSACATYQSYNNYDYGYDANGNKTAERECATVTEDGSKCATYASGYNYDYGYDANGNQTTQRTCATLTSDGSKCATYDASSDNYDYTYDANGNQTTQRRCEALTSDGNQCAMYASIENWDYGYDANGNQTTQRRCATLTSDGSKCATYESWGNYDWGYDANGNKTTRRECATLTSDGSKCATYSSSGNHDYGYDANGNMTSERKCATLTADGSQCATYASSQNYDYGYDANGNQTTQRTCATLTSDGSKCDTYKGSTYVYTYDDTGKRVGYYTCSGSNLNTATGECIAYNSTAVSNN